SSDSIEQIDVSGIIFSIPPVSVMDDVLVAVFSPYIDDATVYPMNSRIDGGEGSDQLLVDYSDQADDLRFSLNDYGSFTTLEVRSYMTDYNSFTEINSIESLKVKSGSGNNLIDLGYSYISNDVIDAGAGDDWINAGLGDDTIEGGLGNDTFFYELGFGVDVISDLGGDNDTIMLNGFAPYDLMLEIENDDVILNFANSTSDRLIIKDYFASSDSIEQIDVSGIIFSIPPVSVMDDGFGTDILMVDYSEYTDDFNFIIDNYSGSNSLRIESYMTGYFSSVSLGSVSSLNINSGSGNDLIDLGVDGWGHDVIDAGAGNDWINASLGDDTIEGGLGNDTIEGGDGSDTYIYESGAGIDLIVDSAGESDTIMFGSGITLDNLSLDFDNNDLKVSFNDSPDDQLIIRDYLAAVDTIENISIAGQTLTVQEVIDLTTAPETIGEFGKVNNFDHNSQTIQLENSYENPVVFALPLSRNGGDPAVVRITDIQNDSFTAYLQEAEYKDGWHTKESFSYLVLEAGSWELDNGSLLEVGTVNTDLVTSEGWENVDFSADFVDVPVVLSQVQTNFESDFVRTRQQPASIDGFSLSMEEEDALKASGHAAETVGWLAIDAGQGTWGDLEYQAGSTGRAVTHRRYNLNFEQDFMSEPSLFASLASYYGGDASGLRYLDLNESRGQIMIEEDQSLDSERSHTSEIVDFLAIAGNGDLTAIAYEPMDIT
ncbi:MAG: calcium-binding protein, partial [Cyanobacteria bacterium J06558_2]